MALLDSEGDAPRAANATGAAVAAAEIDAALGDEPLVPIRTMLEHARRTDHAPKDILYHEGTPGDTVYFVTAGLLKLVVHLPNGQARIVRLHRPGSVLGLSSLLGKDNEHTAVAVTDLSTLRLPSSAVQRLREEDPETYIVLLERWHRYLQDADRWITDFSTGSIRARVARLVAFLADFEPEWKDGNLQLLTCEEMGCILGVTGESVSRVLAQFKREDILARNADASPDVYEADVARLHDIGGQD